MPSGPDRVPADLARATCSLDRVPWRRDPVEYCRDQVPTGLNRVTFGVAQCLPTFDRSGSRDDPRHCELRPCPCGGDRVAVVFDRVVVEVAHTAGGSDRVPNDLEGKPSEHDPIVVGRVRGREGEVWLPASHGWVPHPMLKQWTT